MPQEKPNIFCYRLAQGVSCAVSALVFRRKMLRNEIKGVKGPFVVIANHQAQFDFVNLIGATHRPMAFVISHSFYSTLPVRGLMDKIGVIPKQQFQTALSDMKRIKAVLDAGRPVALYPAGLMCEDGLSTPIPQATYKFLKWLGVDVYMARTSGAYFVQPKWGKGLRAGRTYMDIYKLFDKQELETLPVEEVKRRTDEALLFDAYREQETYRVKYRGSNVAGLQNVLYRCPHCGKEFTVALRDKQTLACESCGFSATADAYSLLHTADGQPLSVSDWSRETFANLKKQVAEGSLNDLSVPAAFRMIDSKKNRFVDVGRGTMSLTGEGFRLTGEMHGEAVDLAISTVGMPTLPFSPGNYLEVQQNKTIYRCVPEDGRVVMKFVNMVKALHELRNA